MAMVLNNERIADILRSHGYQLKQQPNGALDFNPYTYEAAHALIALGLEAALEALEPYADGQIIYTSTARRAINALLQKVIELPVPTHNVTHEADHHE